MLKKSRHYLLLLSLLLPFYTGVSLAGSPMQDFNDEKLLSISIADVGKMGREEIEAFISFLGTCSQSESNEFVAVFCGREREVFMLKYSRGRALDRLIRVHALTWKYVAARENAAKSSPQEKAEIGNLIERYVDISGKLSSAATQRFQLLAKVL